MKPSAALFCLITATAQAGTLAPFDLSLPPSAGGGSMSGATLASGLNFPIGMALLPDGSIAYGSSAPLTGGGIEFGPSVGSVWVLPRNADGSFGTAFQAVNNLGGVVTGVRSVGGLTVVDSGAASSRTENFYDQNFNLLGSVGFSYPNPNWEHSTGVSLIAPQANGTDRIYFIVGSETDSTKTTDHVTASGLFNATLNADSVYMVTVSDSGGTLSAVSAPTQIATGLRNPYGLTLNGAGDLIIGDNGQDGAHVVNQMGADTLEMIPAAQIGKSVFDFGFPDSYVDFATGAYVSGDPGATAPLAAFRPVNDANGVLQYSEGLSGMAYVAPGSLPFAGPQGGEIVAFDGISYAGGAANNHDALLYYDFATGMYFPLLDGGTAGVGHPDSVLVSGNTIFIADTSIQGNEQSSSGANTGAIYEFTFVTPEPGTIRLAILFALAVVGKKLKGRNAYTGRIG